jgi:acyl-CoA synthetase (AMP-forming)/AMP-acid ligase II
MLHGQIMDWPLTTSSVLCRAAEVFPDGVITSRLVDGRRHSYSYLKALDRAKRLARALQQDLGIKQGDRVATLAWNTHRHFESYYAISGIGAICHTLNPRYAPDQLQYILDHAADVAIMVDTSFIPLLDSLSLDDRLKKRTIVMSDSESMPDESRDAAICYESLLNGSAEDFAWPALDERAASSLCYTSGTTGDPKGALYSHRSVVLHALCTIASVAAHFMEREKVLAVVPLFHVNAWGLPFAVPITGTSLVLPGPHLDGKSLFDLMDEEEVTSAWGVPTIWLGLLAEMRDRDAKPRALQRMVVGGAAPPRTLIKTFETEYGVEVDHGWGMTEMSPVGSLATLPPSLKEASADDRLDFKTKQGRRIYGVDMRIVSEAGAPLAHDGKASGELQVRGAAIINEYYNNAEATQQAFTEDGWLRTGDLASIDPDGCVQIVDRAKDMIKSGGEWISSIAVENAVMDHPAIAECCVIGVPHPHWQERPLLLAVVRKGHEFSGDSLRSFLTDRLAKIAIPDEVVIVPDLPRTATGKVSKRRLREMYKDHFLAQT